VLGGGGARAAYQAGVLRCLARHRPDLRFPIVTGVSAGAINATFLASFVGTPGDAAQALTDLWGSLTVDNVFCASLWALAKNFFGWGCRLTSCGLRLGPEPRGLVDTEPLRRLLRSAVGDAGSGIPGIARNIATGADEALRLADFFCRAARRRIRDDFRALWSNDDVLAYRIGQRTLEGRFDFLEDWGLGLGLSADDLRPVCLSDHRRDQATAA
jgi:predicted acylesterase/phospholipase RssA